MIEAEQIAAYKQGKREDATFLARLANALASVGVDEIVAVEGYVWVNDIELEGSTPDEIAKQAAALRKYAEEYDG